LPLDRDDPAREKIAELKASNATAEEVMAALDTYEVTASYLVKGLSPGHARLIVAELIEHLIQTHMAVGTVALSTAYARSEPIPWLDGPLFGGPMQDA
jgi:hypothetical protein